MLGPPPAAFENSEFGIRNSEFGITGARGRPGGPERDTRAWARYFGRAVSNNVGSVDVSVTWKDWVPTLLEGALSGSATTEERLEIGSA